MPGKGWLFMVTCLRCGKKQHALRKRLGRARGVRCNDCGGPVELSEAAREVLAQCRAARQTRAERKKGAA